MKKLWSVAILLLLSASSAWAGDIRHTIGKGDCLSRLRVKYGVSEQAIQKRNDMGKSTILRLGKDLWIPAKEAVTRQAIGRPVSKVVSQDKHKQPEKVELSGLRKYSRENAGRDRYKGSPEKAAWLLGLVYETEIGRTKVIFSDSNDKSLDPNQIIRQGELIKMTSGQNKVGEYISEFQFYTVKSGVYVDGEFRGNMYWSRWCNNWIRHEEKPVPTSASTPSLPPTVTTQNPAPKPTSEPPSIFVNKKEENKILRDQELDVGGGLWQSDDNSGQGAWWFAQYKNYLHKHEKDFAGGILTPVVGAFARGDLGRTDAGFKWNNAGVGPQAGAMWNGVTDAGYPQQVQVMFRTLWEHMHGENSASGYAKTEDHALLAMYAEYLRQFAPDLMHILYAEGWADVASSFKSTWSGDKASSRTAFAVGYKLHKQWSDKWASRFGVSLGWAEQDSRWSAGANIEMRYNDGLLVFGPNFDYTLASAIQGAAGHFSYGPFVRGEFHKIVKEEHSKSQSAGVQPSDRQLILY